MNDRKTMAIYTTDFGKILGGKSEIERQKGKICREINEHEALGSMRMMLDIERGRVANGRVKDSDPS